MTGGMPSPIFTEWGTTPITKKVGNTAEEKIEIRIDPSMELINYSFKTNPDVKNIRITKVLMHQPHEWDVYFYNDSGAEVEVEVHPLYLVFQI
ncbi:hypothetical protein [Paenibacillus vandeheii]